MKLFHILKHKIKHFGFKMAAKFAENSFSHFDENHLMVVTNTKENADPKNWLHHHFGLPNDRWSQLKDKLFWVTGAGTGYGRSVTCALSSAGSSVIMTGRRIEKLQETLSEMRSLNIPTDRAWLVVGDLTKPGEIMTACESVRKMSSTLDGMVHCAAIPSKPGSQNPLQGDPVSYWDLIINTNVRAPWLLTREMLPHMLRKNSAKVVFFSSEAGWSFTPGYGMYNISKTALNALSHSMAAECSSSNPTSDIQINTLIPGEARTEMNQGSDISPYSVVSMTLLLLSHPPNGPNGMFFHRDGRHLCFGYSSGYNTKLL